MYHEDRPTRIPITALRVQSSSDDTPSMGGDNRHSTSTSTIPEEYPTTSLLPLRVFQESCRTSVSTRVTCRGPVPRVVEVPSDKVKVVVSFLRWLGRPEQFRTLLSSVKKTEIFIFGSTTGSFSYVGYVKLDGSMCPRSACTRTLSSALSPFLYCGFGSFTN